MDTGRHRFHKRQKRQISGAVRAFTALGLCVSLLLTGCSSAGSTGVEEESAKYSVTINYPESSNEQEEAVPETGSDSSKDVSATGISLLSSDENGQTALLEEQVSERLSVQLIELNEYSRPGDALNEVNNIVVHYLGNAGTTAQENRDYFASLAESGETYASCHFVIGLEGEIIQLIPLDEISYCSNDRNEDTIAIECCHPDEAGYFNDATYESLVLLTSWLCSKYDLTYSDVIRHYDVTGKLCPLSFATDPDYWYGFKAAVANTLGEDVTAETIRDNSEDTFASEEEITSFYRQTDAEEEDYFDGRPHEDGPPDHPGAEGGGPGHGH